ncbi:hypothetical protein WCX18_00710 [Sulfurimonas sp. HSL1-2]|uniref:hypothetical protein n=1 Tax=Thiomicrolovo zhangzhouensis TaxID=3131933 RepID=UPI0031F79F4C
MLLLPSVKDILKLYGFNSPEQFLYKVGSSDTSDFPTQKTLKNIFSGETSPSRKTIEKLGHAIPENSVARISLQDMLSGKKSPKNYISEWEPILEGLKLGFPPDFFPKSFEKLEELITSERKLIQDINKTKSPQKKLYLFAKEKNMQTVLSKYEQNILKKATALSPEVLITLGKAKCKIMMLFAAYFDAEIGIAYQEKFGPEFSFVKLIMPRVEENKYLSPIERLFRRWKDVTGVSFKKMAEFIQADTQQDDPNDAAWTKFKQWRRGEHPVSYRDMSDLLLAIKPDIAPVTLENSIMLYYHALALHSFFQECLGINTDFPKELEGKRPFQLDSELVEWMQEYYETFFDMAYKEFSVDQA